ncbi:MAG TPA: universal stress protein [Pirellulales bacterium]|nr:universal stress protein [Pirellulales bacterium]
MSESNRILVGIDLLQSRQGELSPPVAEAVKQALWLAAKASGAVTFFAAVEVPEEDELYTPLGEHARIVGQVEAAAQASLDKLVEQATGRGVKATGKVVSGQGWIELAREAIEGKHDVVVVGTRNLGAVRRALFGSTAVKLLHNCPGAVWVTKPQPQPTPRNILVASDFSQVSDEALRLALRLGSADGLERSPTNDETGPRGQAEPAGSLAFPKIHLLHVLERPYARLWEAGLVEARGEETHHQHDRDAARKRLGDQLARVLERAGVSSATNVELSVADGTPVADEAILRYIDAHQIDLLVMGTSARHGLAGAFVGNTAERLLTSVPCSLLAVKPADFVCPVRLESYYYAQPTAYL